MALLVLDRKVYNLDGDPMVEKNGKGPDAEERNASAVRMIANALIMNIPEDPKKPRDPLDIGKDKLRDYELAVRIKQVDCDEEVELSSEEITVIKERVAICYTTVIVGQIWNILEGK